MSIRIMADVWAFAPQKGSKLLLLLAIADFADDDGKAFPSLETLSKKIRMSERNTQYLLRTLEKEGALKIEYRPYHPSLYTVLRGEGANFAPLHKNAGVENPSIGCNPLHPIRHKKKREKKSLSKNDKYIKRGLQFLTPGSVAYEASNGE